MVAVYLIPIDEGLPSQGTDKLGEPHTIVAPLHADVATEAGPDRIILRCVAVLSQPSLCYESGVKIRVVLGNWTHYGALAAVKAEAYPSILYPLLCIEHLGVYILSIME